MININIRINRKQYILILLFIAVTMVIGIAALSQNFSINGTSTFMASGWEVKFQNIVVNEDNTVTGTETITNDTTVNYSVTLNEPGDKYSFTVDAVNVGNVDAMIGSVSNSSLTEEQAKLINYSVSYDNGLFISEKDLLERVSGSSTIKISFEYKEVFSVDDLPDEPININLTFSITYIQADDTAKSVNDILTFIDKAKAGNATSSDVGKTFTVNFGPVKGDHNIRVANVSTPSSCSGADFSQTACGVVLEFADTFSSSCMNDGDKNVGGWPASEMRAYVSSTIYNLLPEPIKNAILETTVISGYGSNDSSNFTSTDKLYLLSAHEVWIDASTKPVSSYDTSYNNTRQLDYYALNNVTTKSYFKAMKDGSSINWWLRSADSTSSSSFLYVTNQGGWSSNYSRLGFGISPAFRIA